VHGRRVSLVLNNAETNLSWIADDTQFSFGCRYCRELAVSAFKKWRLPSTDEQVLYRRHREPIATVRSKLTGLQWR
jgi:hypothetical protein